MRLLLKAVSILALLVTAQPSAAQAQEKFSFVVSGGVSLGSYEAGMSWALLKSMKLSRDGAIMVEDAAAGTMPELATVAGASAGGINALAASLAWCADDLKSGIMNSPGHNIFRDMWLDVGIDDLMPPDVKTRKCGASYEQGYCEDDALLSRGMLREKEHLLADAVSMPLYIPGCEVRVAFTVTRTKPEVHSIKSSTGRTIQVENERFVIPLILRVDAQGMARFENFEPIGGYEALGNVIFLRRKAPDSSEVSMEDVLAAMEATSAFPIAFSNRWLDYCRRAEDGDSAEGLCPNGFAETGAFFVDGGVFDNKPLGVAREVAECIVKDGRCAEKEHEEGSAHEYSYIYIDPGSRRFDSHSKPSAPPSREEEEAASLDLLSQLSFISGAVSTGLQYELYNEVRSGEWTGKEGRDLLMPSRFPAITAQYLEHFGAFLDDSFRQYDYYAGVYDAVHGIATYLCMGGPRAKATQEERMACYERMRAETFIALGLRDDVRAAWVFDCLASHEQACSGREGSTAGFLSDGSGLPSCTPPEAPAEHGFFAFRKCGIEPGAAPPAGRVGENLRAVLWGLNPETCMEPEFEDFLRSLCVWFDPLQAESGTINTIIGRYRQGGMLKIMLPLASRASLRQVEIERDAYRKRKSASTTSTTDNMVRAMAGVAAYKAEAALEDERGAVLSRSSARGWGYRLLPYQISKNVSNRGWSASWESRLRMSEDYSLNIKLAPYAYEGDGNRTVHYLMAAPNLVKKVRWGNTAGIGPAVTRTWGGHEGIDRVRVGGEGFVGFADIVRFTVGKRSFLGGSTDDDWYYMLGVTDVSGLVYWARRVMF